MDVRNCYLVIQMVHSYRGEQRYIRLHVARAKAT